jgi:hypothetical protein
MLTVELIAAVAPDAIERARRLEFALRMLRVGTPAGETERLVRLRFSCSQATAWRTVSMAIDLEGPHGNDRPR